MSAASRRKGLTGEREARELFAAAGFEMRGLEGAGDWIAFRGPRFTGRITTNEVGRGVLEPTSSPTHAVTLHVEVKRYHDRARFPEWWEQASTEAPAGVPPLLCTRADRGEWLVTLRLADLLNVIA